ncbi:EVC protein, partial [Amia calva]|nr:EVC protein [Amia calva]
MFQPLADGASNPSLHENCKMVILPNQMPEDSSLSSLESLSQENEDDSSQFISSSPIPKAFQNEKFIKIKRFPETLSSSSFDSRISLYWLGLQSFEHVSTDLHEVKNVLFLQVLRILLNEWSRNEIVDDAFYSSVLAMQERELKKPTLKLSNSERLEEPNSPYCTLEEIERNEKDKLEYGIQMRMNFNKQVEGLCQHLQSKPTLPHDLVGEMTKKLIENLVLVENLLTESQSSDMMNVQEKLVWWECISATLESKPLLLKQEAVCRLKFTAKVLEQLTSDGKLTFQEMEKILSDLQKMFQDEIQQYTDECNRQTKDLVNDMIRKFDTRRKNLHKIQAKERRHFQDSVQQAVDPMEFVKAYHDLLVKQKKEGSDLEDQQDVRIAEAVCELWKRLHSSSSQKMVNTVQELFLGALPSQTQLPQDKCELLRQEANRDLSLRLQTEEANAKHHLELFKDHLERQKQIWREEEALTKSILKHLTEQQQKLFQGTIVRQRDLLDGTGKLTHMKHSLLLQAINRQFSARQFSLGALKEMRLSRVKSLVNETRQERTKLVKDITAIPTYLPLLQESSLSEVERRLTQDSQMIGVEFQQEFLSELSGATELLQEHAAMVIGRALAQKARQQAAKANREGNESIKHHLKESATESVCVTRESVSKLIENHYTHIQSITQAFEQDQHHRLQNIGGEFIFVRPIPNVAGSSLI